MHRFGLFISIILLVSLAGSATLAADFEPIPKAMKEVYTFDLEKNFYADQAGFQVDLDALIRDVEELEALKGKVGESADNLYRAYELSEKVIPTWWKLWVYAYLTYATNTDQLDLLETIEKTSGDLEGKIQFVKTETQDLDEVTLERYFKAKPALKEFEFAIEEARRYLPYTLSLPEEELLATMSPYLGGWSEKLYQKLVDRTDFPDIVVDGDTLDVNLHYSVLINSDDREVRKDTWTSYFESMADQRDLYAFTLIKAIETRDKKAQVQGYRNYPDAKFFGLYLDYDDVAAYFDEIATHAHLRKEYERVRRARIMADTGYDTVYIWDRQVQAGDFEKPRFDIKRATDVIMTAMQPVGDEYQQGLKRLLDPNNRLLDIVSGEKRVSGMFATSYPTGTSQFFSQTYNGYLSEVNGLAHESGHAVHHMMQNAAGVRPIYYDGASYLTESVAMTSELLLNKYLYENETDLQTRAYYLEQLLENALGLLINNMFAHLEFKIYESIEDGSIKDADDLDTMAFDMVIPYSMYYGNHPQYKTLWAVIHHYYDAPMYNINYVIAQALSLVLFDKVLTEPGFVDKYQAMLRAQFDKPTPDVIKEATGIYMLDPTLLSSGFAFLEEKIEELKQLYRQLGIEVD